MTNPFRFSRSWAALLSASALMIPLLASCGGSGGGSKTPSIDAATPAPTSPNPGTTCNNDSFTPNYARSVSLLRWQVFPLRIFFEKDDQYSVARQNTALAGFNQWLQATENRADYSVVNSREGANVTVSFYRFTGGSGDTLGTTTVTYDSNNIIRSAEIELGITGNNGDDVLTAAHEYGHALGITGHSPSDLDLMYFTGNVRGDVTRSDLNTLLTAYCNNFNRNSGRTKAAVGPLKTIVIH